MLLFHDVVAALKLVEGNAMAMYVYSAAEFLWSIEKEILQLYVHCVAISCNSLINRCGNHNFLC